MDTDHNNTFTVNISTLIDRYSFSVLNIADAIVQLVWIICNMINFHVTAFRSVTYIPITLKGTVS